MADGTIRWRATPCRGEIADVRAIDYPAEGEGRFVGLRSRWHLQRSNGAREVADIAGKGGRDHFQTWNEGTWRVAGGY